MQPTLVLRAPQPGILYLNGNFAGELGGEQPLIRPTNAQGPLYLDYRPLKGDCRGMARKLVFSSGAPMAESAENADGLSIVVWPGNVVEIELTPPHATARTQHFQMAGHAFEIDVEAAQLYCDGHALSSLPDGAQAPQLHMLPHGAALLGSCDGGQYLITCDPSLQRQSGFLRAMQIEMEADGHIRAIVGSDDLVGHATLESWRLGPEGLSLLSSESAWTNGAPLWPKTPAETAFAAVEAALAGLDGEAEGYLSPMLRSQNPLRSIGDLCDLCVEMRFAVPDSRPCVGLLRMECQNMARVQPLYYRASPSGGPQGAYLLDALEFG